MTRPTSATDPRTCIDCGAKLASDNFGHHCSACQKKHANALDEPPKLPREFFDTDAFRAAFDSQDMGRVLRVYRADPRHRRRFGPQGISQATMASWLGISQVHAGRIENGKQKIRNWDTLLQCVELFGLPPDMLWFDLPNSARPGASAPSRSSRSDSQGHVPQAGARQIITEAVPNDKLRAAREAMPSRTVPGEPMRRAELAEAVNAYLWEASNKRRRSNLDDHTIGRYERGEIRWPSEHYRRGLRAVLNVSTDGELGFWPTRRGNITAVPVAPASPAVGYGGPPNSSRLSTVDSSSGGAATITDREDAVLRREFLTSSLALGISSMLPKSVIGQRVDTGLVAQLRQRVARLRRLDDFLGGADTYPVYRAELESVTKLYKEKSHSESVSRELLSVIAEQAQQAGWAAFDAGHNSKSHELFKLALRSARDSQDSSLEANSLAYLAYQEVSSGGNGVNTAIAACRVVGSDAPTSVRALLFERLAWAHAKAGQPNDAERALANAKALLEETRDEIQPGWSSWVDKREIKIMSGRCWAELRRPMRAVLALEDALADFDDTHSRDKALYLSWLADAYLETGEIEQSTIVINRAMNLMVGVGSIRPQQRIREFTSRLMPYRNTAPVRDLLARQEAVTGS